MSTHLSKDKDLSAVFNGFGILVPGPKLTAGRQNISAFAFPEDGSHVFVQQDLEKRLHGFCIRFFQISARVLVKGNEVDLGPDRGEQSDQLSGMAGRIIYAFDQNIFKRYFVSGLHGEMSTGSQKIFQRIGIVDRHQVRSGLVIRGIEGNCQVHG